MSINNLRPVHDLLHGCPGCGGAVEVTRLACPSCGITVEGRFQGCDFCRLDPEQRRFVRVFLQCRGNIREVERALGISYPTVRGRLAALLAALGAPAEPPAGQKRVLDLLRDLQSGRVTLEEALHELAPEGGEDDE